MPTKVVIHQCSKGTSHSWKQSLTDEPAGTVTWVCQNCSLSWRTRAGEMVVPAGDADADPSSCGPGFRGNITDENLVKPREVSVPNGFAAKVLETVRNRGSAYGHPQDNHELTAHMFNEYMVRRLKRSQGAKTLRVTAEDVCVFNVLQKISRIAFTSTDDSWLDIAGYAENVAMLREDQRNR